jgi:hypothetical protein
MERIKVLIGNKQYKEVYKYIIKNFKREEYSNYFRDIKEIAFELISIYENSKALRLFRELDKIDLEEDIKLEIIKILTKREKYKSAYRYIIKNFKIEDYSNYCEDIKNVVFGLIRIGKNSKALKLFRKMEELDVEEDIKKEMVILLTKDKRYKAAYRYIIKNFDKEDYYKNYKDVKNVAFDLINIGKEKEVLILFRKLEGTKAEEDIKKEIVRTFIM